MRQVNTKFWKGKRVYLTGHTGFKGSWLSLWLSSMGAIVKGYALSPNTEPALFNIANVSAIIDSEIGDIRNLELVKKSMATFGPDILIHLAAQPLVRLSYHEPIETYSTNVMGTANVLEAARYCDNLKAIVSVTTDKVYENKEWVWGYREEEPIGGYDPYSSSKGCAELITSAYRRSFFSEHSSAALASARAGNVIGGGDWALDRLIPDVLRSFAKREPVIIRNPLSTRPWQHVLEPLSGYLLLAESLYQNGHDFASAWNFGPEDSDCKSVAWILDKMVAKWKDGVAWKLDKDPQPHEARFLKLDCSKAKAELQWSPIWNIETVIDKIYDWQNHLVQGADMQDYCLKEIHSYQP